jgi:hypothetical protein
VPTVTSRAVGIITAASQGNNQTGDAFRFNPKLGTLLDGSISMQERFTAQNTFIFAGGAAESSTGTSVGYDLSAFSPRRGGPVVTSEFNRIGWVCYVESCTPTVAPPSTSTSTRSITLVADKNGGAIPYTIDVTTTPAPGAALQGSWQLDTTVDVRLRYEPFTAPQYIRDALSIAGGGSPQAVANSAASVLSRLRTWDAATSSENLALRDAEYWLLGYAGGQTLRGNLGDDAIYNLLLAGGPVSIVGWKALPKKPGDLPGTPIGGFEANFDGLVAGVANTPLDQAVGRYGNNRVLTNQPTTPVNPLMPLLVTPSDGDLIASNNALFDFVVQNPGETVWVDPIAALQFIYAFAGNFATGVQLPTNSDDFTLQFLGMSVRLRAGEFFSFLPFALGGVDQFTLTWNGVGNPDWDRRPVVGIQFALAGETLLDITTIRSSSTQPVPEPATLMLLCGGVAATAARTLRRRST